MPGAAPLMLLEQDLLNIVLKLLSNVARLQAAVEWRTGRGGGFRVKTTCKHSAAERRATG